MLKVAITSMQSAFKEIKHFSPNDGRATKLEVARILANRFPQLQEIKTG